MTDNHVLFVLDGLRYDVYKRTETQTLPGNQYLAKAHSHAVWTVPSFLSYLLGYSPTGVEDWPFYQGQPGADRVAQDLQERDYTTEFHTGSAWMTLHSDLFEQGFDEYDAELEKDRLDEYSEENYKVWRDEEFQPFFQVFHIMEPHHPSYDGENTVDFETDIYHNFEAQQKALKYVDQKIGEMVEDMPEGTVITVTADHGDAWGENQSWGHNPNGANMEGFKLKSMPNTVHEIPYMRGTKQEDGTILWKRTNYLKGADDNE